MKSSMVIRPIRASGRWFTLIAVASVPLVLSGLYATVPGNASSTTPAGVQAAAARTGHVAAGTVIHAATSSKPFVPTAAEKAARARDMKLLDSLKKAPIGPHTTAASVAPLRGPQTSPAQHNAPTTFTVFKDTAIPASCPGSCAQSTVNEPDTANSGKYIVQTSNWDIAYTTNGGASPPTWNYQNPYSLSGGFCCDQAVTYVPSRDRFVYEGLTLGSGSQQGITIATTRSTAPTSWCVYHFDASAFGGTSGDLLDYPKIAYSNNYIYLTWNHYNFSGGSGASQDGRVTNWCSRLDPRWETAWISRAEYNAQANSAFAGDTILGVAITAGPGGGDPFPYVIYEYFKLNALSFIQTSATFNDGFAFAYAGCAPNAHGYVGCAMSWGGGTGTGSSAIDYYPGGLILLQDNVNPTQPWGYDFNLFGSGNASAWGDYMVTQPFEPDVGPFITTEWAVNGSGIVVPHVVIWGRGNEYGYARFKTS